MNTEKSLRDEAFPRSSSYDVGWVLEHAIGGAHPLWLPEWLCSALTLRPGMRVLDLGCGNAFSSIFLAKEFGVQVWANDLWIPATENWRRISDAGAADLIPDGWKQWLLWEEVCLAEGYRADESEAEMLRRDAGRNVGFTRVVAHRKEEGVPSA